MIQIFFFFYGVETLSWSAHIGRVLELALVLEFGPFNKFIGFRLSDKKAFASLNKVGVWSLVTFLGESVQIDLRSAWLTPDMFQAGGDFGGHLNFTVFINHVIYSMSYSGFLLARIESFSFHILEKYLKFQEA